MNFEELERKIIDWGEARGIFNVIDSSAQFHKLVDEVLELSDGIRLRSLKEIEDGIGDVMVVLTMIAHIEGMTLGQCYAHAYNEIKDRKGKMVNGVFVKEEKENA